MKKYSLIVAVLLTFGGLLVPARAQEAKVIVTVPFDFIVGTEKLPAGKYTVSTTSSGPISPLLIFSRDHGTFLIPTSFDDTQFGNAGLSFDHIGNDHVLSGIKTATGSYTIDNHREVDNLIKLAQSKDRNRTSGMTSAGAP